MNEQQTERFSEALVRLAGDESLLEAMAAMVSDDAPVVLSELSDHIENGRTEPAARTGHKLKGMCSTFETGSPITELEDVIRAAKVGDADETQRLFQECQGGVVELIEEIRALK